MPKRWLKRLSPSRRNSWGNYPHTLLNRANEWRKFVRKFKHWWMKFSRWTFKVLLGRIPESQRRLRRCKLWQRSPIQSLNQSKTSRSKWFNGALTPRLKSRQLKRINRLWSSKRPQCQKKWLVLQASQAHLLTQPPAKWKSMDSERWRNCRRSTKRAKRVLRQGMQSKFHKVQFHHLRIRHRKSRQSSKVARTLLTMSIKLWVRLWKKAKS